MSSTAAVTDLLAQVRTWCETQLRVGSVAEAEALAVTLARQVAAVIVSEGVRQAGGRASYEGCSVACECGQRAKFKGYRGRWLVTLAGTTRVARAYYYCRHCHTGQAPWDRRQGLSAAQWTAGVKGLVAHFAGRLPYAASVELLELSTGLKVEAFSAEQIMRHVGEELRAGAAREQAVVLAGAAAPAAPPVGRLYIGLDGTHGHIDGDWHEVKVGAIFTGRPDADGVDQATDCQYLAAQETAEAFGERAYAAAVGRGVEQVAEAVVTGDGADWIWNQAALHFPRATQVVDYWHASEHLWQLRRVLYPAASPAGDRWVHEHCRRLYRHGPNGLLRALARIKPATPEQAEAVRREQGYFSRHRHRMDYPGFRARGLMVGSGPVEAACKLVVGQRLKGAGMRWCQAGADAVLAVRCVLLNKQLDHLTQAANAAA
jgi:hypothetical protein